MAHAKTFSVKERFAINFFRWSQVCLEKEIDGDFPLLNEFEIGATRWFLHIMDRLDSEKKHLLGKGLLKRAHSYAADILKIPTTTAESDLVEWYLKQGKRSFETGERKRFEPAITGVPLSKRQMRAKTLDFLGSQLGKQTKSNVPGFLNFECVMLDVCVRTVICFGGQRGDLIYHQELLEADGTRITYGISVLSWLGVSSQTGWENLTETSIEKAFKTLLVGCSTFISAVPDLVH